MQTKNDELILAGNYQNADMVKHTVVMHEALTLLTMLGIGDNMNLDYLG